uniref:F-box domain-containing protein n=1 Tax=Parascaris univalens TaxID=6257 RepID=A0A915AIP1_PARUN
IDRVHSASLVCTRWNRLLYTPGIWTDVGSSIQKLCLCLTGSEADYPRANEVGDILPSVMPQVTLLDVGYFAGGRSHLYLLVILMGTLLAVVKVCCERVRSIDRILLTLWLSRNYASKFASILQTDIPHSLWLRCFL